MTLGYRFKNHIRYRLPMPHVLRRRGSIYINESPRRYGINNARYTQLSVGISVKRGCEGWVRLPAREIGAVLGRVCVAPLFAQKLHVLSDLMVSFTFLPVDIFISQYTHSELSLSISFCEFQLLQLSYASFNSGGSSRESV